MKEDELLKELEQKLNDEYKDTESVIRQKIAYYTKGFDKDNKLMQKRVKSGEISEKEYRKWYKNEINTAKWCNKMAGELSEDMAKASSKAGEIINGYTEDSFSIGCLDANKEIADYTNFDLIDKRQVETILDDNRKALPKVNPNIPKEERWSQRRIKSALLQSAIKGESVPKLAKRLEVVVGMGKTSAIRNARTMMTASHNMGRLEVGYKAKERGIDIQKKWLATYDNLTRDSHALLNGEVVEIDEEFSNGLMYPADPDGDPAEVYNCRCSFRYVHEEPHGGMSEEEFEEKVEQVAEKKEAFKEANKRLKEEAQKEEKSGIIKEPTEEQRKEKAEEPKSSMREALEANNVEYKEVKMFDKTPSQEEIISRLGGGDKTTGSCASLGFAYIGNRQGYDVLDFRGGASLNAISKGGRIKELLESKGGQTFVDFNAFKATSQALQIMAEGKEYYLSVAQHASIIRKIGNAFEYLELQSPTQNGWKPLNNEVLKRRFGCKKSSTVYGFKLEQQATIADIDGFKDSEEFRKILGYINTDPDKQRKGFEGSVK